MPSRCAGVPRDEGPSAEVPVAPGEKHRSVRFTWKAARDARAATKDSLHGTFSAKSPLWLECQMLPTDQLAWIRGGDWSGVGSWSPGHCVSSPPRRTEDANDRCCWCLICRPRPAVGCMDFYSHLLLLISPHFGRLRFHY